MRLLVEGPTSARPSLLAFDLWEGRWRSVDLRSLAEAGCPTCRDGDFPWLDGRRGGRTTVLCGRDAVQIAPASAAADLAVIAARLRASGRVAVNEWLVRAEVEPGIAVSVFADGRVIVQGTRDESRARRPDRRDARPACEHHKADGGERRHACAVPHASPCRCV